MPSTIDADPSSLTFNCYTTLDAANVYHGNRLFNATWYNAPNEDKRAALIWATRTLDTLRWRGVRTSGTQNLEFPRKGLTYYESADIGSGAENTDVDVGFGYFTKVEISDSTVPTFLANACAELAFWLMENDSTAPTGLEGMKRIKVDVIEIESLPNDREGWFTDPIRNLCWRFLKQTSKYSGSTQRVG